MGRTHSPHGRIPILLASPEGDLVALHRASGGDAVLVGAPGEPMRAIPATRLRLLRDGGTVSAETREGVLDVPGAIPPREPAPPTWAGRILRKVDPEDYDIDLAAPGGPTVSTKSPAPAP